jgi:hypothetical protein
MVAMAILLLVPAVIVWRVWPVRSDHRLSSTDAERACRTVAARGQGRVDWFTGDSVDRAVKVDLDGHFGGAAFLASLPKSSGVAVCSVLDSNLPSCGDGGDAVKESIVLATPDGRRWLSWCLPSSD